MNKILIIVVGIVFFGAGLLKKKSKFKIIFLFYYITFCLIKKCVCERGVCKNPASPNLLTFYKSKFPTHRGARFYKKSASWDLLAGISLSYCTCWLLGRVGYSPAKKMTFSRRVFPQKNSVSPQCIPFWPGKKVYIPYILGSYVLYGS